MSDTPKPPYTSEAQAALAFAQDHLPQVQVLPEMPGYQRVLAVPKGMDLHAPRREKMEHPRFLTAQVEFQDPAAFIEYVNHFKEMETVLHMDTTEDRRPLSRIWYDVKTRKFTAILDYHQMKDSPQHGDHVATLALKLSPEWEDWIGISGKEMDQLAMAEFLEDHAVDMLNPSGPVMVEVASKLEATIGTTFQARFNRETGQRELRYEEIVDGKTTGSGTAMPVPHDIEVALRPFLGGTVRMPIPGKFRYRVLGTAVKLHIKLLRVETILEDALNQVVEQVALNTGIRPALGSVDQASLRLGV